MALNPCPNRAMLSAFLLGDMAPESRSDIEEHLDGCDRCQAQLAECSGLDDPLLATLREPPAIDTSPDDEAFRRAVERMEGWDASQAVGADRPVGESGVGGEASPRRIRDYTLLEKLGEGGMGAVFKARHDRLKRTVAIKLISATASRSAQSAARFQREFEAIGAFDHPHIVRAFDAGEVDGVLFLAMEFVDGHDLAEIVRRVGVLSIADACELARQAALALAHAHNQGLVHRDVKPSNLMLATSGQVKLLDLGLARLRSTPEADELTSSGQMMGTLDYMAPEQLDDSRCVDIRADIYSLGATLYKLLSGRSPTGAAEDGPLQKLRLLAAGRLVPLRELRPDLPSALAAIVDRMLAIQPSDRYATPDQVVEALLPFCREANLARLLARARKDAAADSAELQTAPVGESPTVESDAASIMPKPRQILRRRGVAAALIATAACFLFALGLVYVLRTPRGVVEIEVAEEAAEDVRVVLAQNGEKIDIADEKAGWKLKLQEGRYSVLLQGGGDRFELDRDTVTVSRNDVTRIKVRFAAPAQAASAAVGNDLGEKSAAAPLADSSRPFHLLRKQGGDARYQHFSELMPLLANGDIVEVHGNGPFRIPTISLDGIGLTIRAAPGFRPRFAPTTEARLAPSWITARNASLTVEGCDLEHRPANPLHVAISGGGRPWSFRNCRLLGLDRNVQYQGPQLTIADSLIQGAVDLEAQAALTVENCLLWCRGAGVVVRPEGGQSVQFKRSTLVGAGVGVFGDFPREITAEPITIDAQECVFRLAGVLISHEHFNFVRRDGPVRWSGRRNTFVGQPQIRLLALAEQDGTSLCTDLDSWRNFWKSDDDSQEVSDIEFQWDRLRFGDASEGIGEMSEYMAQVRRRHGIEDLGPDWRLVGPGDAYVRSLALRGQSAAPSDLRPAAPEEGPFVVLRPGEPAKGYASLHDALDRVASGDTIEIRSDGPFSVATRTDRSGLVAALRAAPGYHPVFDGDLILAGDSVFTIEGVEFRKGSLHNAAFSGRVTRLANCSFIGGRSVAAVSVLWSDGKDGPAEIENCWIGGDFEIWSQPQQRLRVRNSLVTRFNCAAQGPAGAVFELDHCVVWRPGLGDPTPVAHPGMFFVHQPQIDVTMDVRATLVEGVDGLPHLLEQMHWSGSHNVFRTPNGDLLEQLRQRGDREDGSALGELLMHDPAQWRLSSRTPSGALGADVDRVATIAAQKGG